MVIRYSIIQEGKNMFLDVTAEEEKQVIKELKKLKNMMYLDCGKTEIWLNIDKIDIIHRDPEALPCENCDASDLKHMDEHGKEE